MQGKICLVTGATNGIGKVTALELAKRGATVVLVSRSAERVNASVQEIQAATGSKQVSGMVYDLSALAQVRACAAEFRQRFQQLHVLVNNAGAVYDKRLLSADGIEMTFALNHFSYFVLTLELLDLLKATGKPGAAARVINVSSDAHRAARTIAFDDIRRDKSYGMGGFQAYAESKLANVLFSYDLARRLQGAPVTVNALHPGGVATGFGATMGGVIGFVFKTLLRPMMLTPEQGAQTSVYLATSPEAEGVTGQYFDRSKAVPSAPASHDTALQARLWAWSARTAGEQTADVQVTA